MTYYRLKAVIHAPSEETGWMYMAEAPALQGCRAWGDTMAEARVYLESVAAAFIESYREHHDPIPAGVEVVQAEPDEMLVAV